MDPKCDNRGQTPALLGHTVCLVFVPLVLDFSKYWISVFHLSSEVLEKPLDPDPILPIFGVGSDKVKLSKGQRTVLKAVILLARRLILLN